MLTLPQGMSREREGLLRLYGARVRGDRVARRHDTRRWTRRARWPRAMTCSCPTSSPIPRTPRSTGARPGRRSRGARRPRRRVRRGRRHGRDDHRRRRGAQGSATPNVPSWSPSSRRSSAVLSGGRPGPAPDPGDRCRVRARGAQPRGDRRGDSGHRRGRDRDGAPAGRAARACWSGISAGAAVWAALQIAARPGVRVAPGSPRSCRTRASATSRRRSSPRRSRCGRRAAELALQAGGSYGFTGASRWPRSGATWPRPRAAIRRRAGWARSRSSRPGPGSRRCSRTGSRTPLQRAGVPLLPRADRCLARAR